MEEGKQPFHRRPHFRSVILSTMDRRTHALMAESERSRRIRRWIRRGEARLLAKHPSLRHQDALGAAFFAGSITGMIALAALGPNTLGVIVVIGLVFAPIIAKTVRAAVLSERQLDYVTAAQLRKESPFYILFVEILPNVTTVIISTVRRSMRKPTSK